MDIILEIIGFFMLWWCVDYKRTPECKISMFSWDLVY